MDDIKFIKDYLNRYKKSLFETDVSQQMIELKEMLLGMGSGQGFIKIGVDVVERISTIA